MIAPSPDWYIGIVNLSLYEGESFLEEKVVDILVFDAGTDDGATFTSSNIIAIPQSPITLLVDTPLGNGYAITPVIGIVTFTKE